MKIWTPEEKAALSQDWRAGMVTAAIAAKHGVSKAVIVGLANRNRTLFPARTPGTGEGQAVAKIKGLTGQQQPGRGAAGAEPVRQSIRPVPPLVPGEHKRVRDGIGIFECRYPMDGEKAEILFCCATVLPGKSWCPHHAARVFGDGSPPRMFMKGVRR